MLTIYQVNDIANSQTILFVPDEATRQEGIALGLVDTVWIVGTEADANAALLVAQQEFLSQQAGRFQCTKAVGETPAGAYIWESCDLSTEPENTTVLYEQFCDVVPGFKDATGTAAANAILEQNKQLFLQFYFLDKPIVMHELPMPTSSQV